VSDLVILSLSRLVVLFHDAATPAIYTLSLHDPLPISRETLLDAVPVPVDRIHRMPAERPDREAAAEAYAALLRARLPPTPDGWRSEEHTSELQSRGHLVCRLLLEKKKTITITTDRPPT